MKEIDFNALSENDLIDYEGIAAAFTKYLRKTMRYTIDEANFVVSTDFENPYNTPFISQDYCCECNIDGKRYEVRYCYTDFCMCGLFHLASKPRFEFYMLFDLDTLPDKSVGSYQNANKMYII